MEIEDINEKPQRR